MRLGIQFLRVVTIGLFAIEIHSVANSSPIEITAQWYQQFDAEYSLEVPAEGYGGWRRGPITITPEHTALVVMHAWQCGTAGQFPGWYRCVEYIPRSQAIAHEAFPEILRATRAARLRVIHIVGGGDYYRLLPGYQAIRDLATTVTIEQIRSDPVLDELRSFRAEHVFPGRHNAADVKAGFAANDFLPEARPLAGEPIVETSEQLFALCRREQVNHLIYIGFALNACLNASPGGMVDMSRHGLMCSTIREATLAVENKETARTKAEFKQALWRVAVFYGFVFDRADYTAALEPLTRQASNPHGR